MMLAMTLMMLAMQVIVILIVTAMISVVDIILMRIFMKKTIAVMALPGWVLSQG